MALRITMECINCTACEPECPNSAISSGDDVFVVDAHRCTECVGHFDESQCIAACPVDCIVPDEDRGETREQLMEKYRRLTADA